MTRSAVQLAERYAAHYTELKPPLNRDLVAAGAILHDIGRVLEFGDEAAAPSVTVPGRLAGHLLLGRDLVRDAARELGDVNPELVQILEHIVLTHLGLPEWGSPRLPLVPECAHHPPRRRPRRQAGNVRPLPQPRPGRRARSPTATRC